MFDPVEDPAGGPGDVRAVAVARLASIRREFPAIWPGGRFRRARRLAPGVYRSAGLYGPATTASTDRGESRATRPDAESERAPSPTLAAVLDRAVPGSLSSRDLLDGVAGWERLIGWAHARQAELVAEFARRRPAPYEPDEPSPSRRVSEFAADEIAARLRTTRRLAEIKLGLALDLADQLPGTAAALQAGRIDVGKAKAIAELTANLFDAEARAAVEARVLARAGEQTVPELRRSLLRAVARVDPAANAKRHRQAREERFLRVQPCCDGMAEMTGRMPAEDAMTVFGAVDALARCAAPDDPRSIEARRVDALVDLCRPSHAEDIPGPQDGRTADGLPTPAGDPAPESSAATAPNSGAGDVPRANAPTAGFAGVYCGGVAPTAGCGTPAASVVTDDAGRWAGNRASRRARRHGRGGPEIQVTVAASTLLGMDDQPGELAGYGPIDAETARRIAADPDATWRRLLTDPVSGILLDYGTRVYRPPESLARHVMARDQVCCFPGCRQPAGRCELDHGVPFPHGPTCEANLIPLCRHHHRAKTHGGWQWRRDQDGTIRWTAPTGHEYQVPITRVLDEWLGNRGNHNPTDPPAQPPEDDPPPF